MPADSQKLQRALFILTLITVGLVSVPLAYGLLHRSGVPSELPVNTHLGGGLNLASTHGGRFDLSNEQGKVVLLTFGYTTCPDICPTNLARMAQVLKALGPDAGKLDVLFVSFDPARDTLPHLKQYIDFYDPRVLGATGTAAEIADIAKRYGVVYIREDEGDGRYGYDHSDYIYLLDTQGRVRKLYDGQAPSNDMATDAQALLAENAFLPRLLQRIAL